MDECLLSFSGLLPVLALANRAGLRRPSRAVIPCKTSKIKSEMNPGLEGHLNHCGMTASADCIDDLDMIRGPQYLEDHEQASTHASRADWVARPTGSPAVAAEPSLGRA
jgi:hypothetical protein